MAPKRAGSTTTIDTAAGRLKAARRVSETSAEPVSVLRSRIVRKDSEPAPPPSAVAAAEERAAQPLTVEDPWETECAPVVALIGEAQSLSEGSRAMLKAGLPHCLRGDFSGQGEVHPFQVAVLDLVAETFRGMEAIKRAAIADKEAGLASLEATRSAALCAVESARTAEAAARTSKDAAVAAADEAQRAAVAARGALKAERDKCGSLAAQQSARAAEKDAYERAKSDFWDPLAREADDGLATEELRIEALDALMPKFKKLEVGEALLSALSVFIRSGERSRFSKTVASHGGVALTDYIATLDAQVEGAGKETAEQENAVLVAEALAVEAERQLDARREESFTAQNAWLIHNEGVGKAESDAEGLQPGIAALVEESRLLKRELSDFLSAVTVFEDLTERPSKADPVVRAGGA